MINPKFQYKTRTGNFEIRFYCYDGNGIYSVHGAIKITGIWILMAWDKNGKSDPAYSLTDGPEWDAIKVKEIKSKDKAQIIQNDYPSPIPVRILNRFQGKRVKLIIEEL